MREVQTDLDGHHMQVSERMIVPSAIPPFLANDECSASFSYVARTK